LKSLRALIVDDELPARKKLLMLLKGEPDVEVVAEASNGVDAIAAVEEHRPDVIFLDIQMPGMNGFEVVDALEHKDRTLVVFVTAYDEHAVKAFEVHALDYLLKPFDRTRLRNCLERIRAERRTDTSKLNELLAEFRPREYLNRVVVKTRGRVLLLKIDEVDWIETAANYVELHAGKQSYLLRETLNSLDEKLDPRQFVRVHRSSIVNLDRIQELQSWSHGDFIVLLKDGTKLRMSRRYKQNLADIWGERGL
jgi:two-component system, LytTR family, response regulator